MVRLNNYLHTNKLRFGIGLGLGVIFFAVVAVIAVQFARPVGPERAAANAIEDLLRTTSRLQDSFSSSSSSGKTAKQYLGYLTNIKMACQSLDKTLEQAKQNGAISDESISMLKNSSRLCDDLKALVISSEVTYTATLPLLTAGTQAKRWQTIPPIQNNIRMNHTAAVDDALSKLQSTEKKPEDFPSNVIPMLKQMQSSIKNTPGLDYLPALDIFQAQLLAERQQYWTAYGGIAALRRTLEAQKEGYVKAYTARP